MTSQDSQGFTWHYTELDDRNLEIRGRTFFFVVVLFSIILIVALLFLYARWIWRYRGQHPTTYHSNGPPLAPPPPPPQGLDPASIKKLPIVLHQRTSDANSKLEETECCICLGTFKDGEKLKVLPGCGHSFHCECVDKWLFNHSSCPICRSSLKVEPNVQDSGGPEHCRTWANCSQRIDKSEPYPVFSYVATDEKDMEPLLDMEQ